MRKKSVITILAFLSALGFTAAASACDSMPDFSALLGGGQPQEEVTIDGFEVKETLEVSVGATVTLEELFVVDSNGKLLDCWTYVTDGNGNYVATNSGAFVANNPGTYTIKYVVRASDNKTYEKETKVTVTGASSSNDEKEIRVNFDQFVSAGETVTIQATCSDASATLTYEVSKALGGESIETVENTFVPEETGAYQVTVGIEDSEVSYTYNVFAQNPMLDGEVEVFDNTWEEKESFVGGKRQDWDIVTSEESSVYDRYGRAVTMAKYTTDRHSAPFYINIRESVEYYEQLSKEGYTYVSMWIYLDSEVPHFSVSDRDKNAGFYRKDGPNLYPGEWKQFKLTLADGQAAYARSFITCYDLYANQNHFYLSVDNSNEWNPWGNEPSMTFYFTGIYAVKPVTVSVAENVETARSVGETIDFSTVFSADCELSYTVDYRGQKIPVDSNEYTFMSNGEYVVTAYPKTSNFEGEAQVKFTVEDGFVVSANPVIKERTGDSVSVSISELGSLQYNEVNGITPVAQPVEKVSYNGQSVELTDGTFVATQDGMYSLEIKGLYEIDGVEYVTYKDVIVDVWSEATKYQVIDTNNMKALRAWDWDNQSYTLEYDEYTVGGRTGTYIMAWAHGASHQSLTFYAKPKYSKAYYQALQESNPDMKVRMNIYFEPLSTGWITNVRSVFTETYVNGHTTWKADREYKWQTLEMNMDKFLSQYDAISERYDMYKTETYSAASGAATGSWLYMVGSPVQRKAYMTVSLGVEATEASVTLKDGEEFVLNEDNALKDLLDVTLDGNVGEILGAEVFFNGEWIAMEDCVFTPVWETEYKFRFTTQALGGKLYKQIETTFTVGDGGFQATTDTGLYTLKKGETFNVSNLLTEDYEYQLEVILCRGTKQTKMIESASELVIDGEGLTAGSYLVNVYAIKGTTGYGKILYYSFTLDYFGDESALTWIETPTNENKSSLFQSYQWAVQNLTGTTVTTDVPAGRSGSFLKYEGTDTNRKEAMKIVTKPIYSKAYYQSLVDSNTTYVLKYDVYVDNVYEDSTRTTMNSYLWNSSGAYKSGTKLSIKTWYTFEVPLEYLLTFDASSEAVKASDRIGVNEYHLFGVYIGSPTSDLIKIYVGNIRLEEAEMMWSSSPLTKAVLTSYQYSGTQNLLDISVTTDIPEGGEAGTYVKYTQTQQKGAYKVAVAPVYAKTYYEKLLATGKKYKVTFDFYVENSDPACTRTQMPVMLWHTKTDGTQTFSSHGDMVTLGTWYTAETDLQYFVDNWDNPLLFGVNFEFKGNALADFTNYWFGNIQLVEGEALGYAVPKANA